MKLSQFSFDLPENLIAQEPNRFRDDSRMMVVNRETGEIEHKEFKDILDYFGKDDLFIFNNTKVIPAKLVGNKEKTNALIDVFLLRELNKEHKLWDVLVDPARKIRIGNKLYFGEDNSMVAEVIDNTTSRGRTLRFLYDSEDHEEFRQTLFSHGKTPIPEYINREPDEYDEERYQTVWADVEGAVVAPAASLHFSRSILKRMEIKDIRSTYLTVHNGLGNYRPIEVEDLTKHKMEGEEMLITDDCCKDVNSAIANGHKICVIGTSTLRAIETVASTEGTIKPYDGWTNKFIFPPYEFELEGALLTNFHMSKSPLLLMSAAFGGHELVMKAYEEAIKEGYKFGAYGDAMLII